MNPPLQQVLLGRSRIIWRNKTRHYIVPTTMTYMKSIKPTISVSGRMELLN